MPSRWAISKPCVFSVANARQAARGTRPDDSTFDASEPKPASDACRMHPDGPDIWAQALYGRDREWAATVDDVVHGRTTVALRGLDDERVRAEVDRMLRG